MESEGNLFNTFCRDVGVNYNYFPIDLNDWKEVPEEKRPHAWDNIVKESTTNLIAIVKLNFIFIDLMFNHFNYLYINIYYQ